MRITSLIPSCVLAACAATMPSQTFTLVHVFHGPEGAWPGLLVQDSSGNLYGPAYFGGDSGLGTVYKIVKKNDKTTVLHSFSASTDGEDPDGLLLGSDGNLYGTTGGAGPDGWGTAFRINPSGAFNVFYSFQGGTKAADPGLLIGDSNALYGLASGGAPFYGGVVYGLNAAGETDLYTFAGGADGARPSALVRDSAGNFYGTALGGGNLTCKVYGGCGVVFKIDAKGVYSVLHVFIGADGNGPSGLVLDPAGNLFGTTISGGASNAGTVFELTPAGNLTTLYTFTGGADGQQPQSGVIRDQAGNLYGTTYLGGAVSSQCYNSTCGVVFMLSPGSGGAWKETVLHTFTGADGESPVAPLLLDPSEPALYGTTQRGGDFNCTTISGGTSCGVVFKITR